MRSRRSRSLTIYAVLGLAAAAVIVFGLNAVYGFLNSSPTSSGSQRTATVARGTVQASVSASGNVGVADSASADFATSGTLTAVDVAVGDHVKAGQVLAKIDATSAQNTLMSAEANLEQAQSALATAQSGLTAEQRAANASSLEQAQLSVTTDEQQLASDRTTLATAKAQLASDRSLSCPASSSAATSANSASANSTSSNNASSNNGSSDNTASNSAGSNSAGSNSASTGNGSTGNATSGSSDANGSSTGSSGSGFSSTGTRAGVVSLSATGSPVGTSGATTGATGATGAGGAAATTTTTAAPAPTTSASTGQVSSVGPTSATFGGSVDPAGFATSYWFDYGTSPTDLSSTTAKFGAGSGSTAVPVSVTVSGLKANTNYLVEIVASSSSGTVDGGLQLFRTSGTTQSAATGSASSVGSTTTTLGGTVSPDGLDTKYWFQYGTSATRLPSDTARLDAGSGSADVAVSASISGLKGATTYYFRVVASNASGTSAGAEATFTTSAAAVPAVETGSASTLTSLATLNGSVDPNGSDTKYWFEYGTTSAYGSRTPVLDAGAGTSATQVSATVSGLKSNTEYLFRLVASNSFGTSAGIGEVAKTAESSCVTDAQTITSDEQALSREDATVEQSKESLTQTEATIAASETPTPSTIASDEATVAQDEATVAADRKALAETTLTAPIGGVVTAVGDSVGETVGGSGSSVTNAAASAASSSSTSSGSGFAASSSGSSGNSSSSSGFITIDSLNRLEIVSGFAEADAIKIAVGQPATITFPALPETEVAGKVVAVSNTSTVVSNVVTYNETIALIDPPAAVKEGMTADVSVVDQSASGVLYLPTSAITTTGTVSTVELLQNGKTTVTRVTTGLVGNDSTQILSGLSLGEVVVEPTITITAASSTSSTGSTGSGFAGLGGGGSGFAGLGGGGGGGFTRGG